MAPTKRPRESSSSVDKTKRRKRPNDVMLYQCMGKLCGEDCNELIEPVMEGSNSRAPNTRAREQSRRDNMDMDAVTDYSDEGFEDDVHQQRAVSGQMRGGRVNKPKNRKALPSQTSEIPFEKGVQVAKSFICEALDFGVQSGYLMPRDSKGKVLRVSSELLKSNDPTHAGLLQRIDTESLDARRLGRKRRRDSPIDRDDEQVVDDSARRTTNRRQRSRSIRRAAASSARRKAVTAARSRSRSKSKRKPRRPVNNRSQSVKPDAESRTKQTKSEDAEQEDMGEDNNNSKETAGSSTRKEDDNDDNKSEKSSKSAKTTPKNEDQTSADEKKNESGGEDDGSNDDEHDE